MADSICVSVFDKLPPELVGEIFEFTVHSSPGASSVLLALSLVCKRFSDITLSTSTLWRRICFPLPLQQLDKWVERCRPHPLEIEIDPYDSTPEYLTSLRTRIREHAIISRTRKLTVNKCAHFLIPDVLCVPCPALRELDIEFCAFEDEYECPSPPFDDEWAVDLLGGHAEKIQELRLRDVPFDWTRLKMRDMKVLDITMPTATWAMELPTVQQFLDTLAGLTELRVLMLDNFKFEESLSGIHVPFTTKRETVHLPLLMDVCLSGPTLHNLRLFLPFLKPGQGCNLRISAGETHLASDMVVPYAPVFFGQIGAVAFQGIGDANEDTASQLSTVEDEFFVITEGDVFRCLHQMPHLRKLQLGCLRLSESFFRKFNVRPGQQEVLAPHLRELRVVCCDGAFGAELQSMVEQKRVIVKKEDSAGGPGFRIVVEMCPKITEDWKLWNPLRTEYLISGDE